MTPQELKNSILLRAVQGRITNQNKEDGDTRDLLPKLHLDKTIKPNDSPFDIPDNWMWIPIGSLGESTDTDSFCDGPFGSNLKSIHYSQKPEVRIIQLSNIGETGWKNSNVKYTSYEHLETVIPRCEVFPGDFVIAKMMPAGRTIEVPNLGTRITLGSDAMKFVPNKILNKQYLLYAMASQAFLEQVYAEAHGITRVRTTLKGVKSYVLPIPPLAEQKRIVAKIEELLPLVEQYEKAYNRLEQLNKQFPDDMKKSILQLAIQGKLVEHRPEEGTGEELYKQIQAEKARLIKEGKLKKEKPLPPISDDEIPFEIPPSWFWVRFGMLGSYKKGPFGSALTKSMFVRKGPNSVKVYEQKNAIQKDASLGDYYISRTYFESKMKGFEVHTGDSIVSCAGTIGETYVLPECIEQGIINQALMRMKIYEPLFIPYFLMFFDVVLKQTAQVGSKGSAIKNIPPFEILNNYLVPIPPLAEQKRIVAKIEELLPLCNLLKEK